MASASALRCSDQKVPVVRKGNILESDDIPEFGLEEGLVLTDILRVQNAVGVFSNLSKPP